MIFSLLGALVAVAYALLRGGSIEKLLSTHFRLPMVLFAGLAVSTVFDLWNPSWLGRAGGVGVMVLSQTLVAAFLAINWRLPGMRLAVLGLVMNVMVIGLNGAMPVSATAARIAGLDELGDMGLEHELLTRDTLLPFLGDVIPLPFTERIVSIGDIVLALGIGRFTYSAAVGKELHQEPENGSVPVGESS
jgi:hypothetical protein